MLGQLHTVTYYDRSHPPVIPDASHEARPFTRLHRFDSSYRNKEDVMNLKPVVAAALAAVLSLSAVPASAGQTINEATALACVVDKWDEKEPDKGHKLVDYAGRCIEVPDDHAAPIFAEDCVGKYEYMPDGSWKGSGSCTRDLKNGDHITDTWEEGSHLKEYTYKVAGGTGKYQGAKGGGSYTNENLTETLSAGRVKGKIELP
jgi:hypothetical protein